MLAKLFQKSSDSQPPPSSPKPNEKKQKNVALADWNPRVAVHYGIPSTASVLAFDPIQRLLAIGTLDGRIKVIGGNNVEGLLMSPKPVPFKNLEFMQNQGILVSVSNENEIQVWDLEKRSISANAQWESNITAFSVIFGTHFMYVGDEFGFLSLVKYDTEERKILPLAYHVPPNVVAEGVGIPLRVQESIVGVLAQPCSCGNRVLIAYESGLIVLWDVTQDRAIHVRGLKDLQLKEEVVFHFSNAESHSYVNNSLDNEEAEKEISSLCWASPDGSVLAVGYVDGDILLWNLLVSDNGIGQGILKSTPDLVKIQLSSGDRRLPVIVLHWSSRNDHAGQLFVYGGEDIGSEEVLTILDLDWSSGLAKLKCSARVDLALHGSFADVNLISNAYEDENSNKTSLFVLTNPGQLNFYEYASLSVFKSGGQNHSVVPYHSVIPTAEPYMTLGKLYSLGAERDPLTSVSETVFPPKLQLDMSGGSMKWPLTGGIIHQKSVTENNRIERIYIGGYQDGSVRIWDATLPLLSLVSVLEFEIKGIQVTGANACISALDFSSVNQIIATGNECGLIFLCSLRANSNQTTVTVVNETNHEVHHLPDVVNNECYAIFSVLGSPVRALQFATCGVRLFVGFESGQVAVLDTSALSVLSIIDSVASSKSSIISLAVQSFSNFHQESGNSRENETRIDSVEAAVFVLTKDAHLVLMDSTTGTLISSQPIHPKENSVAVSLNFLECKLPVTENDAVAPTQLIEVQNEPLPTTSGNQSVAPGVEDAKHNKRLASQILLCCEDALYFYSSESVIQGNSNFVCEIKLDKPCSWSTIFKKNEREFGIIIVYQTGEIEMRSLPDLEMLGNTSLMSVLRWNFKTNMERTIGASDKGLVTMVSGSEFAFVSLMASENELRIPESLPSLHDKSLAAASSIDARLFQNRKKTQSNVPGFVSNMIKGFNGEKAEQAINDIGTPESMIAHLERIFSRFPFSDTTDDYDLEDTELHIDDIDDIVICEPVVVASSSQKIGDSAKEREMERERLFEGGSSDTKPKTRTREEIIAKYRNTGDAAAAASQAKDKLLERGEKLEHLSRRTEELQDGAQNFASMAQELAKQMEKRNKWWRI